MIDLLSRALVLAFVVCCIASAGLQLVAWSRHAKSGIPVNIRALWRPEGYFDEVGLRQIRFARRLLTAGALAYLTYGLLLVIGTASAAR